MSYFLSPIHGAPGHVCQCRARALQAHIASITAVSAQGCHSTGGLSAWLPGVGVMGHIFERWSWCTRSGGGGCIVAYWHVGFFELPSAPILADVSCVLVSELVSG